jgi:hypothetical protein
MPMGVCPRCHSNFTYNDYDTDFIHDCSSGIEALDKEDTLKIDVPNANLQGMENKATGVAKFQGEHITDKNTFGNTESAFEIRAHQEYITLK